MNNHEQKTESQQNAQKVCPHCAEMIGAAAKLCPRCRRWQKTWSVHNPNLLACLWIGVIALVGLSFLGAFDSLFGPKRDFAPFQGEIQILSSSVTSTIWGNERYLVLIGLLTNKTEFAWKQLAIEAQFFDATGKMIDTHNSEYGFRAILPHTEQAFKLSFKPAHPEEKYSSHKVFVRSARDAREAF